jgi:electron transfer flavoprotein alpha subunit
VSPSAKIIAINKDPDAEIFRAAETGIVADWKIVVPKVIAAIRAKSGA